MVRYRIRRRASSSGSINKELGILASVILMLYVFANIFDVVIPYLNGTIWSNVVTFLNNLLPVVGIVAVVGIIMRIVKRQLR